MKLVAIGVGGSGAACIEVLVHLAALGLLPAGTDLIPVTVDPDQQHPRIQATNRFITHYAKLTARRGSDPSGMLAARIERVVNTNALRPSDQENLFGLLGLHHAPAEALARAFFPPHELGTPRSREFANGFYGRVNAGVCFFNDAAGRTALMKALRHYLSGNDAVVVLIGSAFGGTGAAGLVHLARVLRDDEALKALKLPIAAIQLEPYFKPDRPEDIASDQALVNMPDTFHGRTGAAYQFLHGLAEGEHIPFDALYPLGVRFPSAFPQDWFKRDKQDNPHLFTEYLAALAVRDFAINQANLGGGVRYRREAVPPYSGPLDELRQALCRATVLRQLLSEYLIPLLELTKDAVLPGHPWVAEVGRAAGVSRADLLEHFTSCRDLLNEVILAAGIDRALALERAGDAEQAIADARRKNTLTRESFPPGFLVDAENLNLAGVLGKMDGSQLFADYGLAHDGRLFVRSLSRALAVSVDAPLLERYQGTTYYHQWTQQEDPQETLGIPVPSDDEFHSQALNVVVRRLARMPWKRPAGSDRTAAEYPTVWAPALLYRDELHDVDLTDDRRYLQLGLLASVVLARSHLQAPPVRRIPFSELSDAFRRSLISTFPLAHGHDAVIAADGPLVVYESGGPGGSNYPRAEEIVGFFFPDTVVVPAPGMSAENRDALLALGHVAADGGFAEMMANLLRDDWTTMLERCNVPNAGSRGAEFIQFLESFAPARSSRRFEPINRFKTLGIPNVADWIDRLYR